MARPKGKRAKKVARDHDSSPSSHQIHDNEEIGPSSKRPRHAKPDAKSENGVVVPGLSLDLNTQRMTRAMAKKLAEGNMPVSAQLCTELQLPEKKTRKKAVRKNENEEQGQSRKLSIIEEKNDHGGESTQKETPGSSLVEGRSSRSKGSNAKAKASEKNIQVVVEKASRKLSNDKEKVNKETKATKEKLKKDKVRIVEEVAKETIAVVKEVVVVEEEANKKVVEEETKKKPKEKVPKEVKEKANKKELAKEKINKKEAKEEVKEKAKKTNEEKHEIETETTEVKSKKGKKEKLSIDEKVSEEKVKKGKKLSKEAIEEKIEVAQKVSTESSNDETESSEKFTKETAKEKKANKIRVSKEAVKKTSLKEAPVVPVVEVKKSEPKIETGVGSINETVPLSDVADTKDKKKSTPKSKIPTPVQVGTSTPIPNTKMMNMINPSLANLTLTPTIIPTIKKVTNLAGAKIFTPPLITKTCAQMDTLFEDEADMNDKGEKNEKESRKADSGIESEKGSGELNEVRDLNSTYVINSIVGLNETVDLSSSAEETSVVEESMIEEEEEEEEEEVKVRDTYNITLFHEYDEEGEHRKGKHYPKWASSQNDIDEAAFVCRPDYMRAHMKYSKETGDLIFPRFDPNFKFFPNVTSRRKEHEK